MPFTIPNRPAGAGTNIQSQAFEADIAILVAALSGTGVVSGCAVTAQGSPDMTVAVAAGTILAAGVPVAVTAGNLTVGTADGTNPRLDLISASAAGVKTITAGTAAAAPKPADLPSGHIGLALVYVAAADTAIGSTEITDKRAVIALAPGRVIATAIDTSGDRTVTSATLADLPTSATSVTFLIPPSGNYLVRLSATAGAQGTANAYQTWGLRESTSIVAGAVGESIAVRQGAVAAELFVGAVKEFYFTGGTPGAARTLKWAAASSTSGSGIKANANSPAIMLVIAL